jgi:hypothetical protein
MPGFPFFLKFRISIIRKQALPQKTGVISSEYKGNNTRVKNDASIKYPAHVIIRYEQDSGNYISTRALRCACHGSRVHAACGTGNTSTNTGSNFSSSDTPSITNIHFFNSRAYPDPA